MSDEPVCTHTIINVCGLPEKSHGFQAPHAFGTKDNDLVTRSEALFMLRQERAIAIKSGILDNGRSSVLRVIDRAIVIIEKLPMAGVVQ